MGRLRGRSGVPEMGIMERLYVVEVRAVFFFYQPEVKDKKGSMSWHPLIREQSKCRCWLKRVKQVMLV